MIFKSTSNDSKYLFYLSQSPNQVFPASTRSVYPVYSTVTVLPEILAEVKIVFCSISMRVASAAVTVPEEVVASAPVNLTVPKLAKGTSEQSFPSHSSKSSTIHSALNSHNFAVEVTALETDVPLLLLIISRVPEVVLATVAVRVIESPASTVRSKSSESALKA